MNNSENKQCPFFRNGRRCLLTDGCHPADKLPILSGFYTGSRWPDAIPKLPRLPVGSRGQSSIPLKFAEKTFCCGFFLFELVGNFVYIFHYRIRFLGMLQSQYRVHPLSVFSSHHLTGPRNSCQS